MALPFIYNILKRHPALMVMIHRTDADGEENGVWCIAARHVTSAYQRAFLDQFNPEEPNPNRTGALESFLWELRTHREHYHSSVSTLARIFEEAFTKPAYSMEDFLDHTYGTVRISRRRRSPAH